MLRAVSPTAASCTGPSQTGKTGKPCLQNQFCAGFHCPCAENLKVMASTGILVRVRRHTQKSLEKSGNFFCFPICGLLSRCCKSILLRLRHSPRRLVRIFRKTEGPESAVFAGTQFNFLRLEAYTVQAFLPDRLQQLGLRGTHGHHPLSESLLC